MHISPLGLRFLLEFKQIRESKFTYLIIYARIDICIFRFILIYKQEMLDISICKERSVFHTLKQVTTIFY